MNKSTRFYFSPSRDRVTWRNPDELSMDLDDCPDDWRPLALIDSEDSEQVGRLLDTYYGTSLGPAPRTVEKMQAALRAFADPKPPKPEEPTGLGAVVEDASGQLWVRAQVDVKASPWLPRNAAAEGNNFGYRVWDVIDAVRVLNAGWSE